MNTKAFEALLEIYKRENDGAEPMKVKMSRTTMADFAQSAIGVNDNIVVGRPPILRRIVSFLKRRREPRLAPLLVYGLKAAPDDTMRDGMVVLYRDEES